MVVVLSALPHLGCLPFLTACLQGNKLHGAGKMQEATEKYSRVGAYSLLMAGLLKQKAGYIRDLVMDAGSTQPCSAATSPRLGPLRQEVRTC